MINIENLTGWLSETVGGWRDAAAASLSGFADWAQSGMNSGIDWITNTLPATINGAIDTATAAAGNAVSNAVGTVTEGASNMVSNAIDSAWDWAGDLIPDGLLTSLGLGGGGLLAAVLGYKLVNGVMNRQRRPAEYAAFRVPAAIYEKIKAILESANLTVNDGEVMEGWAIFSVPRYHLGPTKRILNDLKVEWDTVG